MLSEFYNNLKNNSKSSSNRTFFGVDFEIEQNRLINCFDKGWWYTVPFASDDDNIMAVRLMPNMEALEMPIVENWRNKTCTTYAPNLRSFIAMSQLNSMTSKEMIEYIIEDWSKLKELSKYFWQITGEDQLLDSFFNYTKKAYKNNYLDEKGYVKIYLDVWNMYDQTNEHKRLRELISKIITNPNYIPVDKKIEYEGIWASRIKNILMYYTYLNGQKQSFELIENIMFNSLCDCHQFDVQQAGLYQESSPSLEATTVLRSPVEYFLDGELNLPISSRVKEHPLFEALQALCNRYGGYNGAEHVAAAAILDAEYNDPIAAWKALTVAAYWSGTNSNTPNIPAWEAAIYLSEKRNWKEINEVLIKQLEFYNKYKTT